MMHGTTNIKFTLGLFEIFTGVTQNTDKTKANKTRNLIMTRFQVGTRKGPLAHTNRKN